MTDFDLYGAAGHLLRRVHQRHNAIFDEELAGHGVTSSQFALLVALERWPDADQITLSRRVAIDRSTNADMINRLVDRGLVIRARDKVDGRRKRVALSAAGREFLRETVSKAERVQERLLAPLTADEQAQLIDLLTTLAAADDPAYPDYRRELLAGVGTDSDAGME